MSVQAYKNGNREYSLTITNKYRLRVAVGKYLLKSILILCIGPVVLISVLSVYR